MRIAIIGTGISGLGAAYLLAPENDLVIYEKNKYVGGHSRTINIPIGNKQTPVDTGFIVFNDRNYPNLQGLFRELGVAYEKSDMSFGVSINNGYLEYGSNSMFAQAINLIRPKFWGMLWDIIRFNRNASRMIEESPDISLADFLGRMNMGEWFQQYYLLAMGAAIWSCPIDTILKFPARTYLQFFKNHGLLSINDHPQWFTVTGGSEQYTKLLTKKFKEKIKINCQVTNLFQKGKKFYVIDSNGHQEAFDQVIFACHADEALSIIDQPTKEEDDLLGSFHYQENKIIVHSDIDFMPKRKSCWSSWVYLSGGKSTESPKVSLSYWMNNLQNIDPENPVFVTLNPGERPRESLIYEDHVFTHPIFDEPAIKAQQNIDQIQGVRGLWFCGAYQGYGFHEDGLLSAVNVAKKMGANIPWQ
ncbi:MAG: NAD(P)/FAD-dependent oxidoreductase [Gammaproteobacteria bacterium]